MRGAASWKRCCWRTKHERPSAGAAVRSNDVSLADSEARTTDNGRRIMRHFLDLLYLTSAEIQHLLTEALRLKEAHQRGERTPVLPGRVLGLIFEKPSLRTRVSFETAM